MDAIGRQTQTEEGLKSNGILHLTATDLPGGREGYMVTWSPFAYSGAVPYRTFPDTRQLRDFLGNTLKIADETINATMNKIAKAPPGERRASIPEVWLTEDEAHRHRIL